MPLPCCGTRRQCSPAPARPDGGHPWKPDHVAQRKPRTQRCQLAAQAPEQGAETEMLTSVEQQTDHGQMTADLHRQISPARCEWTHSSLHSPRLSCHLPHQLREASPREGKVLAQGPPARAGPLAGEGAAALSAASPHSLRLLRCWPPQSCWNQEVMSASWMILHAPHHPRPLFFQHPQQHPAGKYSPKHVPAPTRARSRQGKGLVLGHHDRGSSSV
mmetsp:Transcript_56135/g.133750  ORF Transcript_56135/g.133750 Transcript_56135/m.133750 type:complete len:217 (-) Transcript_56135:469-1119(-)